MSMLLPEQLAAIRAADFDFNAGFLDRMAISVDEFIEADGMTAAGPSPGPLTEIVENHALLVEIIAGATAHTNDADRTRVSGIKGLSVRLEALRAFCQRFAGMSIESLVALRAAPDKFDAAFLNRVADAHADFVAAARRVLRAGQTLPTPDGVRQAYDTISEAIESAHDSPSGDLAKIEAIERLTALRDDLRELLP